MFGLLIIIIIIIIICMMNQRRKCENYTESFNENDLFKRIVLPNTVLRYW